MVIIRLKGGLGNQLFQYAFGEYLKDKYKISVSYDDFKLRTGNRRLRIKSFISNEMVKLNMAITVEIITRFELLRILSGYKLFNDDNFAFDRLQKKMILDGYWQELNDFTVTPKIKDQVYHWLLSQSEAPDKNFLERSIVCQIRRGDYSNKEQSEFHGILPNSYYNTAVSYFKETYELQKTFVVSDSISEINLQIDELALLELDSISTMRLMAESDFLIISNSTFAWWAAVIGKEKVVIAPATWLVANPSYRIQHKSWILLK